MAKLESILRKILPFLLFFGTLIVMGLAFLVWQQSERWNAHTPDPPTIPNARVTPTSALSVSANETARNKHLWPFAADSIWNYPIGSDAQYRPANLQAASHILADVDYYIVTTDQDPEVTWYNPGNWGPGRCRPDQALNGSLHIPENLIVPDATHQETPNNAAAFLQPDGQTLIQLNPLARCQPGGPVFGYAGPGHPEVLENIYGSGITGGHGGSGLSSIGGTLRQGELLSNTPPIRHALKLNLYAHKYLYDQPPGYRWPAIRADAYAFERDRPDHYGGKNPALVMGALLAIAPQITEQQLSLQTLPAQKIFQALQNYGGYIVDDSAWDAHMIAVDQTVLDELETTYGNRLFDESSAFAQDINRIFQALSIVENNRPNTVGGGGTPRQAFAPPIGN